MVKTLRNISERFLTVFFCYNKSMKRFLCLTVCLCLAACAASRSETALQAGADRDGHGCIASAGYTYVSVLGRCARLWEEGVRLNPVQPPAGGAVLSAFAVLSESGAEAELFLPEAEPVTMSRSFTPEGPYWTEGNYRLERLPQGWRLYGKDLLLYTAPNPPDAN